jgi:hypothetical protein
MGGLLVMPLGNFSREIDNEFANCAAGWKLCDIKPQVMAC